MPELPEVEIVKQSLEKSVKYKRILTIIINNRNLRFKVDKFLQNKLKNKKIISLYRKAKYLILEIENKNLDVSQLKSSYKNYNCCMELNWMSILISVQKN